MANLIYSVEDDTSIRELVNYALTNTGYEVVSFDTAEALLSALETRLPDLIILDIMLPAMDGIEALKTIRTKYKNVGIKIIMLTAKANEINKITGLDSGADDYITKPFSVLELTARIKAHLRKYSAATTDGALAFGGLSLNPSARAVTSDGEPVTLTYKEFELLQHFMKNAETVIAREDFLRDVWGDEYFGDSRTVDIHIKNLRAKLKNNGDCIVSVRGVGYVLKGK
ncbi:MAG: response regulator transcription factor [Firmicutes bacterium]|nr:response regulator transcription factor [Bacillota bacterium]